MKQKIELSKKQKLLLAVGAGVLILIILWPVSSKSGGSAQNSEIPLQEEKGSGSVQSLEGYINNQEKRLKGVLSKIEGVGDVYVMITAKASKELVVEKDISQENSSIEETDTNGGSRTTNNKTHSESTVTDNSGSKVSPYVVKSLEPEIEGVAIAAQGADRPEVVSEIMNTVSVLFDVPLHKIKVVKME